MKDTLVRFGVAMESGLLGDLDALVRDRGGTRSEILRDLVRAEVTRAKVASGARAVAALTLVYDHHVRDLTEKLTEFQHQLGDAVRSTMHVHLDHDNCLEVIVMRGRSDELRRASEKILATRGVKHGGVEIIAETPTATKAKPTRKDRGASLHTHGPGTQPHAHPHGDEPHVHETPPRAAGARTPRAVRVPR